MKSVTKPKPVLLGPKKLNRIAARKEAVQSSFILFLVAVVSLFLLNGGLEGITDVPSALDAYSRISSLIGTALMLMLILLTSRAPWIDRAFGMDVATKTHKQLGKPAFYLIMSHLLASLLSYAMTDGRGILDEWWHLASTFEDFFTATLSTLLLVLVVVTSFGFVRKRIKFELWKSIHLLAFLSAALALPHILNFGTDLLVNEVSNYLWVFANLFVGLNVLAFRFVLPVARSLSSGVRVSKVIRESKDSVSVYLAGKNLQRFDAKPGQYFQVRFLTRNLFNQSHPFSLSDVPGDELRFTIADRGDGSKMIQHLRPGVKVSLSGPFGVFTEAVRTKRDVALIAAGIGIPPVLALAKGLSSTPGDVSVMYRVRDEASAPLMTELRTVCNGRGHRLNVVAGSRPKNGNWLSESEADEVALLRMFPRLIQSDVYICGPDSFTQAARKSLVRLGIPDHQIHHEEFAW